MNEQIPGRPPFFYRVIVPFIGMILCLNLSDSYALSHGKAALAPLPAPIHLEGNGIEMKQNMQVSGRVYSEESGESLPGVNILVKGSTVGTVTDLDGNYYVEAPEDGTLVFSFIGFTTIEEPIRLI